MSNVQKKHCEDLILFIYFSLFDIDTHFGKSVCNMYYIFVKVHFMFVFFFKLLLFMLFSEIKERTEYYIKQWNLLHFFAQRKRFNEPHTFQHEYLKKQQVNGISCKSRVKLGSSNRTHRWKQISGQEAYTLIRQQQSIGKEQVNEWETISNHLPYLLKHYTFN